NRNLKQLWEDLIKETVKLTRNRNLKQLWEDLIKETVKLTSEMEETQKELKERRERREQDSANPNAKLSNIVVACVAVMLIFYLVIIEFASFKHMQEFSKGHKGVLVCGL
nr:hypothetical protein [Tanacetum cinerariifolium]